MSNKFSRALRRLYATCFNNWTQNCICFDKTAFYGDDGLFANTSAPWFTHYGLIPFGLKRSSCMHIKPVKKQDFSDSIVEELELRTLNDLTGVHATCSLYSVHAQMIVLSVFIFSNRAKLYHMSRICSTNRAAWMGPEFLAVELKFIYTTCGLVNVIDVTSSHKLI